MNRIRDLQTAAGAAGDIKMAAICAVALGEFDPSDYPEGPAHDDIRKVGEEWDQESAIEECRRVLVTADPTTKEPVT